MSDDKVVPINSAKPASQEEQIKQLHNMLRELNARNEALIRLGRRTYKLLQKHYTDDYIHRVLKGVDEVV